MEEVEAVAWLERERNPAPAPQYLLVQSACGYSCCFLFLAVAITCFTLARNDLAFALAVSVCELIVVFASCNASPASFLTAYLSGVFR
jgi:hypothetical protein